MLLRTFSQQLFLFSPKTIGQGPKQAQEHIGMLELENLPINDLWMVLHFSKAMTTKGFSN